MTNSEPEDITDLSISIENFRKNIFPLIEIDTPSFRGIAKHLMSLPYEIFNDFFHINELNTGEEQFEVIMKTFEWALDKEDFAKLKKLSVVEIMEITTDWGIKMQEASHL